MPRLLTRDERSAIAKAAFAKKQADPAWYATYCATVSQAQKKRFARKDGKADQKKMTAARWQDHEPLSAEAIRLAKKLSSARHRNPRTTARQMLAQQQEQRT